MAKNAYIGVDGKARKVKKMYIGVNGVARRIKKAYIGVGGVARLCWSGGELAYHGMIEMSVGREGVAGTTIGDYALFAGGRGIVYTTQNVPGYGTVPVRSIVFYNDVDAYNKSLTHTIPTALSEKRAWGQAITLGDYALFDGGNTGNASGIYPTTIDAYNKSLTRSIANVTNYTGTANGAAAIVGNFALFAGGSDGIVRSWMRVFNTSLTQVAAANLTYAAALLASASVKDYAIFTGGSNANSNDQQYSYAYNSSLTKQTLTPLTYSTSGHIGVSVGENIAMFAGGRYHKNVWVYENLALRSLADMSVSRYDAGATTLDENVIIAGGSNDSYISYSDVLIYDKTLTAKANNFALSKGRRTIAATVVGNYALFAGGESRTATTAITYSNAVDVFTV